MLRPVRTVNHQEDQLRESDEEFEQSPDHPSHPHHYDASKAFMTLEASIEGLTPIQRRHLHELTAEIKEAGVPKLTWGNGLLYQPELAIRHSSLFNKINEFGDLENLAMVLYQFSISKDVKNPDEINHLVMRMVDSYQNMLTTFGVVGALIASVVYVVCSISLPSILVCDVSVSLSLIHLLLPACIL
jgi:hypothetical protein